MPVQFGPTPPVNQFKDASQALVEQEQAGSNLFQSILGGAGDVIGLLGRPASAVAGFSEGLFVKNDLGKAFNFAKQGFMGDRQFSFSQVLDDLGMPKYGSGIKIPLIGEITGRGVLGFALDVALDPLTYTGLGALVKSAKYIPRGLGTLERETLGGLKQGFKEMYDGLLHAYLKTDANKVDTFFDVAKKHAKFLQDPEFVNALKTGEATPFLPGKFEDIGLELKDAAKTGIKTEFGRIPAVGAKKIAETVVEEEPLKVLLKSGRGQVARKTFDEMVLPTLKETFKKTELAGIDATQVKLFNDAAQILDMVTDVNMQPLQMYRNIAARDMGFLGHTLTDQAAKGYRSIITFMGMSPEQFAAKMGMPEMLTKQLRVVDKLVFQSIDSVLGGIKTKFPKQVEQLYRMFHSGTGIPEVDDTISKFTGEGDFAARTAMTDAMKKHIEVNELTKNMNPNELRQFMKDTMDQLEFANPNNGLMISTIPPHQFSPGSEKLAQELRVVLDDTYRKGAKAAKLLNLPDMRYLKGYFPREATPEMKMLLNNILEDAPGGVNSIRNQVKRSRTGDFAKLTTTEINEFFAKDYAGFEHLRQAVTDPNSKWAEQIKKEVGKDPEMWSYFVEDPLQAIYTQNINATKAATKAELTASLLKQFGVVAWSVDNPRPFGVNNLIPNLYKVTKMDSLSTPSKRRITREVLELNKNTPGKVVDRIYESMKNYNLQDRVDAAINPDKFVASKGGSLSASLLANLPAHNIHAFGLMHDLQAPVYQMDEQIHRLIENMWTKVNDPKSYHTILQGIDWMTNFWKRAVTVSFPSFHFRNMIGDSWLMHLDGFNHITESGANGALVHAGKVIANSSILRGIKDLPEEAARIGNMLGHVVRQDGSTRSLLDMWHTFIKNNGLSGIVRDIPINGQTSVEAIEEALKTKFKGMSLNPFSKNFVTVAAGGKANEVISAYNRFANYISLWKKGMGDFDAMMNTRKVLFDYSDLSSFEKNYMKRIFPFYVWSRKNIPFQLKMMVQQPGKFANLMKAVNAVENDEVRSRIPPGGIPKYIKQEFGITTEENEDGSFRFLMLGNYIPAADLLHIGSLEDAGHFAVRSLHPALQAFGESVTNKNLYTNQNIKDFRGEKGIFLGQPIDKDVINAAKKLRPFNAADKFFFEQDPNNPYQKKQLTTSEKLFVGITGLQTRDIDTERVLEINENKAKAIQSRLTSNLKKAVATGDTKMQDYLQNLIEDLQAQSLSEIK